MVHKISVMPSSARGGEEEQKNGTDKKKRPQPLNLVQMRQEPTYQKPMVAEPSYQNFQQELAPPYNPLYKVERVMKYTSMLIKTHMLRSKAADHVGGDHCVIIKRCILGP